MNFNTYVINLKQDIKKWNMMKKRFKKTDLQLIRFDAIDGKRISPKILKETVTPSCSTSCPKSVIGCGASHIRLAKQFLEKDPFDFCLILEDDMIPQYTNLTNEINKCIDSMGNVKWDIIKLYCHGICYYDKDHITVPNKILTGSAGAYLLSKNGAKKISKMLVEEHIDMQYNYSDLLTYLNKYPLFTSYFDDSSTSNSNTMIKHIFDFRITEYSPPFHWWLGMKRRYVPYFDIEITVLHQIIVAILIIFIVLLMVRYY